MSGRLNGTPAKLGILLHQVGCVNIILIPYVLDFSSYRPRAEREAWARNFSVVYKSMIQFIARLGSATQEELEQLYEELLREMQAPEFGAIMFLLTVWGVKPL